MNLLVTEDVNVKFLSEPMEFLSRKDLLSIKM